MASIPDLASMRREYSLKTLTEDTVLRLPIEQFNLWLNEALDAEKAEPTAMHLSTCSPDGRPSGRIVLLKKVDTGLIFFTNYNSRKGDDLLQNPNAALTFWWPELQRQVRVEGIVEKVAPEISEEYFNSRPYGSRIGAVASPQSRRIEATQLEQHETELKNAYPGPEVPRPEHWGGYRLVPVYFEFWQGRPSRLHDRICFAAEPDGSWQIYRLAP